MLRSYTSPLLKLRKKVFYCFLFFHTTEINVDIRKKKPLNYLKLSDTKEV